MTQDEIIEMAKQAGMDYLKYISPEAFEKVTVFVKLVAQHEREACAELRHKLTPFDLYDRSEMLGVMNQGLDDYQNLIRARGQA